MAILTTAGSIVAIASGSAYLLRRRISKKWIDLRKSPHDLTNKTILITGGNAGLGFEAAKDFARRNGKVILACRDLSKGRKAVMSIRRSTGNENVNCMELDLASISSVRNFIKDIKSDPECSSIHALVCNAGVWVPDIPNDEKNLIANKEAMNKTKDGYEIHFGVNHLSHFLLATSLKDELANSGDGRVVFVSSSLMKSGKIDLERHDHVHEGRQPDQHVDDSSDANSALLIPKKKSSFGPPSAYCDTKLMNALTCKHLAATILPPTVTTYAVCPGFCRSSLGRHVVFPFYQKLLFAPIMLMIQRSAVQGAHNIIFATVEEKDKLQSGAFYKDGKVAKEEMDYVDSLGEDLPRKLWELSDGLLKETVKGMQES